MHVPVDVRENLRKIMDDPFTNGKDVARRMGCSRSMLYLILKGEVGVKTLRKLEKVLPPAPPDPD